MSIQESPKRASGESIGALVAKVTAQFSALIRDEIAVTKLNAKDKVKSLGAGGALLAVAGVIALYFLSVLVLAAGFGLGALLGGRYWAGLLIVAGVLLLITLILALVGVAKLKASKEKQINPGQGISKSVDAFKKGLSND